MSSTTTSNVPAITDPDTVSTIPAATIEAALRATHPAPTPTPADLEIDITQTLTTLAPLDMAIRNYAECHGFPSTTTTTSTSTTSPTPVSEAAATAAKASTKPDPTAPLRATRASLRVVQAELAQMRPAPHTRPQAEIDALSFAKVRRYYALLAFREYEISRLALQFEMDVLEMLYAGSAEEKGWIRRDIRRRMRALDGSVGATRGGAGGETWGGREGEGEGEGEGEEQGLNAAQAMWIAACERAVEVKGMFMGGREWAGRYVWVEADWE